MRFWELLVWGPHQVVPKAYSCLWTEGSLLVGLGCQESNWVSSVQGQHSLCCTMVLVLRHGILGMGSPPSSQAASPASTISTFKG